MLYDPGPFSLHLFLPRAQHDHTSSLLRPAKPFSEPFSYTDTTATSFLQTLPQVPNHAARHPAFNAASGIL